MATAKRNFATIKWSDMSLPLSEFVKTYSLPQFVKVEEGYCDLSGENSLSLGETLKVYTLTSEKKLLCFGKSEKELRIPVTNQKVYLKPPNYDTVYQRVVDLSSVKHLPRYVEVTRGYINVNHYKLSVDVGEILEVVNINQPSSKKNRSMTFRNSEGALLKLPFDCAAGFKPLVDNKTHFLADIISSKSNSYKFPFYFQFDGDDAGEIDVLQAASVYEDKLIMASCGQGETEVIFMISQNLKMKITVAVGTLTHDPEYQKAISFLQNYEVIETNIKKSSFYRKRSYISSNSDVFTIPLPKMSETKDRDDSINAPCEGVEEGVNRSVRSINNNGNYHRQEIRKTNGFRKQEDSKRQEEDNDQEDEEEHLYEVLDDVCANAVNYSNLENDCFSQHNENHTLSNVREMSVETLCNVLHTLHMSQHVKCFVQNQVDGSLFCELEEDELKDLGLNRFEIKKLHRFKCGWRPKLI